MPDFGALVVLRLHYLLVAGQQQLLLLFLELRLRTYVRLLVEGIKDLP